MPFIVCPRCQQATDFAEPVGDFSTQHLLCEKCAEAFEGEIREAIKTESGEEEKDSKP